MINKISIQAISFIIIFLNINSAYSDRIDVLVPYDFNIARSIDIQCDPDQNEHLINRTKKYLICMSNGLNVPFDLYVKSDRSVSIAVIEQKVRCKKELGIKTSKPDHILPLISYDEWVPKNLTNRFLECEANNNIIIWVGSPKNIKKPSKLENSVAISEALARIRRSQKELQMPNLIDEVIIQRRPESTRCRHTQISPGYWESRC